MTKSSALKDFIAELRAAAVSARSDGKLADVAAIEAQIRRLEADRSLDTTMMSVQFSNTTLDADAVRAQWRSSDPDSVHAAKNVCVMNYGERGSITFVGGSILLHGSVSLEPKTALLVARYAKQFHSGAGLAFGSPEFLLHIEVANAVIGSRIAVDSKAGTARVQDMARSWRPLVAELTAPTRPRSAAVSTPPVSIAAPAG